MHENLKYTLKLDQNIKQFKSFKDKDPNNEEDRAEISDWQAIYADTRYGTHYFIYAKFIGKKCGNSFEVNKIQLYLQNYRGQVSISFVDYAEIVQTVIHPDDPDLDPRYPNRKKYALLTGLCGMTLKRPTYSFSPKKKLMLNDGDIIMTQPVFVPVDTKYSRIFNPKQRKEASFVDEMFMNRFGSNIFVTQSGKDRLLELYRMQKGLVSKKDLIDAGVDLAVINKLSKKAKKPDTVVFAPLDTPKYPCIPIYSICEIK